MSDATKAIGNGPSSLQVKHRASHEDSINDLIKKNGVKVPKLNIQGQIVSQTAPNSAKGQHNFVYQA